MVIDKSDFSPWFVNYKISKMNVFSKTRNVRFHSTYYVFTIMKPQREACNITIRLPLV